MIAKCAKCRKERNITDTIEDRHGDVYHVCVVCKKQHQYALATQKEIREEKQKAQEALQDVDPYAGKKLSREVLIALDDLTELRKAAVKAKGTPQEAAINGAIKNLILQIRRLGHFGAV